MKEGLIVGNYLLFWGYQQVCNRNLSETSSKILCSRRVFPLNNISNVDIQWNGELNNSRLREETTSQHKVQKLSWSPSLRYWLLIIVRNFLRWDIWLQTRCKQDANKMYGTIPIRIFMLSIYKAISNGTYGRDKVKWESSVCDWVTIILIEKFRQLPKGKTSRDTTDLDCSFAKATLCEFVHGVGEYLT